MGKPAAGASDSGPGVCKPRVDRGGNLRSAYSNSKGYEEVPGGYTGARRLKALAIAMRMHAPMKPAIR